MCLSVSNLSILNLIKKRNNQKENDQKGELRWDTLKIYVLSLGPEF